MRFPLCSAPQAFFYVLPLAHEFPLIKMMFLQCNMAKSSFKIVLQIVHAPRWSEENVKGFSHAASV